MSDQARFACLVCDRLVFPDYLVGVHDPVFRALWSEWLGTPWRETPVFAMPWHLRREF